MMIRLFVVTDWNEHGIKKEKEYWINPDYISVVEMNVVPCSEAVHGIGISDTILLSFLMISDTELKKLSYHLTVI